VGQVEPQAKAPKPDWVEALPDVPGRLYALGTADLSTSESQSIKAASDRARLEVVARLRSSVKGGTSSVTRIQEFKRDGAAVSGYGERTTRDEVKVDAKVEDLPGLVVERTHVDPGGRTAYALAYLDVAQATSALTNRLHLATDARKRVGDEATRQARWRLRKVQGDLGRLEELSSILAVTGALNEFGVALEGEKQVVMQHLAKLDAADLPPVDLAKCSMSLHVNLDLPGGIQDSLESCMTSHGLRHRDAGADFLLDLSFQGGDKGPAFIFPEMAFGAGVLYRVEAQMRILDASGVPLTKVVTVSLTKTESPEGLVEQFRHEFERRLVRLMADVEAELQ
jgi:hypothetical protein